MRRLRTPKLISLFSVVLMLGIGSLASARAKAASFQITGSALSSKSVQPGSSLSLQVSVKASAAISGAIVDVEAFDATGTKVVSQTFYSGQSFTAGQTRNYAVTLKIPTSQAACNCFISAGIFTANWTHLLT